MTAPNEPSGPIRDVYGRRSSPLTPRGVGSDEERAITRAIRNATAEQSTRLERDVRTGVLPVTPGTHGADLTRELRNLAQGVQQEISGSFQEALDVARGMRQGLRRQFAEATVALDRVAQEPSSRVDPATAARAQSAAQTAQAANPRPAPPRGDPVSGERGTDRIAEDGDPDPIAARRARLDAALGKRGVKEVRSFRDATTRAQVETSDAITSRVGDYLQQRSARIAAQAPNIVIQDGKPVLGRDHAGRLAGTGASQDDVVRAQRASRSAGVLGKYGASLSNATSFKEGLGNALPGGAVRAAGVAGAAYAAGNKVMDFAEGQRAQNDAFRSIQGGEGLAGQRDAYGERLEMRGFQVGHRLRRGFAGGMSSEQAGQLFMGASELGLQGEQRDQALDLGTANFRKYAMDITDSLRLITAATKTGQTGLSGIAEALEQVTEAAVKGGVNAKQARDNFVAAYERTAPTFAGQGTATALAAGVTSATASLGPAYQNVDFGAALNDPMQLRRIATAQGRQLSDVVMDTQGAEGAAGLLDTQRGIRDKAIMGQFSQPGRKALAEATARAQSENRGLTPQELEDLARQSGLDPVRMQMLLSRNGVEGVDLNNALQTAIGSVTGTIDPARDIREQAAEQANYTLSDADQRGRTNEWGEKVGESARVKETIEDIGGSGKGLDIDWNLDNKEGPANAARRAYMNNLKKTGQGSPLIEKMLRDGADQKIVVKAGNKGKDGTHDRVVSVEEAVKHFGDQLSRGDAKIAGTDQTLADTYGFEVDQDVEVTSDAYDKDRHGAGRSLGNWNKEEGKDSTGGGEVIIRPTPALERLLRFETSGNARRSDPLAPSDAHVPNSALPTGTRGP